MTDKGKDCDGSLKTVASKLAGKKKEHKDDAKQLTEILAIDLAVIDHINQANEVAIKGIQSVLELNAKNRKFYSGSDHDDDERLQCESECYERLQRHALIIQNAVR